MNKGKPRFPFERRGQTGSGVRVLFQIFPDEVFDVSLFAGNRFQLAQDVRIGVVVEVQHNSCCVLRFPCGLIVIFAYFLFLLAMVR